MKRTEPADHLETVGAVVDDLRGLGFDPVLVGGMALVTLGSRRVTRDFDFVVAHLGDRVSDVVALFYKRGLELASRIDDDGEITATISNRKVAAARLQIDSPATVHFIDAATGLRIDLLFDFPVPAAELAANATRRKIASRVFLIASEPDLLRLKQIARAERQAPGDAEDLAFLEARAKR